MSESYQPKIIKVMSYSATSLTVATQQTFTDYKYV